MAFIKLMVKILIVFLLCFSLHADDKASADELKAKLTPVSLNFDDLDSDIKAYLDSVPEERKKIETTRLSIVKNFKKMVQKVVGRSPYEGKIFLKSKTLMGKIMEAKDDQLTIVDSNNATSKVKWEDLNLRQYSDIFIAEAVSKGKDLKADKRSKDADGAFKKAGNYYFALAVFYDWYGNIAASKIFRKKALVLNPDKKKDIEELWPSVETLKN